jgi:Iron-containing redox enzyme
VLERVDVKIPEAERLRTKVALVLPALVRSSLRLADHPRISELYPEYLFTVHTVIRASVPLMDAARRQAEERAGSDAVSAGLAAYLVEHIGEERDHDEWLLDDLEALGVGRADVLARPPSPTVAAVVGAQYYWIFHYHPVALLGYIAVLEGYPPTTDLIERIRVRTGYPRDAFRTLLQHAELDPGHREELDVTLDGLPLTEEQAALIGVNAMHTVQLLSRSLDEIVDLAAVPG